MKVNINSRPFHLEYSYVKDYYSNNLHNKMETGKASLLVESEFQTFLKCTLRYS